MKRKILISLALATALIEPSYAYIPPAGFVVRTMAQKKSGFRGFRVRASVSNLEGDKPGATRFRETTWVDMNAGLLRSRALDDSGRELYVMERKLTAEDSESTSATRIDRLLFSSSAPNVIRELVAAGVPLRADSGGAQGDEGEGRSSNSRMARWSGTVAWVFGSSSSAGELWIEKDTFLPLRLLSKTRGSALEARFDGYRFFKDFPYPKTMDIYREGASVLRAELVELQVNPDLGELKRKAALGWTEAGNSAPANVRELIRSYFDLGR
jgi:hypothetical protein